MKRCNSLCEWQKAKGEGQREIDVRDKRYDERDRNNKNIRTPR